MAFMLDKSNMKSKALKICFVWYWERASEILPNWRDGLRSALVEVSKKHEVRFFVDKQIPNPEIDWDFILFWSDSNCEFFDKLGDYKCRKGICLTTDPTNMDNLRKLDVVFCESDPIYNAVRSNGIRAIKAFGTDTDFFKPLPKNMSKDIEYFYPATFSPWKRQDELAYLGDKLLCVGTVQPDGQDIYQKCVDAGVKVKVGYFSPELIKTYYQRSKNVIIPSVHGSERTVLEAMSCGIKPEVTHKENIRTYSYIKELEASGLTPREFVLQNYSHIKYAKDMLKGIEQ